MKKLVLKLILTVAAIVVLIASIIIIRNATTANSAGTIVVEYVGVDNQVIKSKEIDYYEGDALVKLVQENFENVVIEGTMIMGIEDYTTPSDWSTFISIRVNGEESMVGITEIQLQDGLVVSLVITEFIYE